eukprot:CAMPEP_0179297324 /NCGR_PEP_ID=MMETSP0797-20121207/45404_1 /TAXON_ID=47934 /ORGANISM="Dinophysis acuminata, Strain DAEP01" /LENGTH=266 /DNA_ID=CAMNT_0021006647 /DNA_START=228 /DNA_END=1024 /DNA_ORIENTATION=+
MNRPTSTASLLKTAPVAQDRAGPGPRRQHLLPRPPVSCPPARPATRGCSHVGAAPRAAKDGPSLCPIQLEAGVLDPLNGSHLPFDPLHDLVKVAGTAVVCWPQRVQQLVRLVGQRLVAVPAREHLLGVEQALPHALVEDVEERRPGGHLRGEDPADGGAPPQPRPRRRVAARAGPDGLEVRRLLARARVPEEPQGLAGPEHHLPGRRQLGEGPDDVAGPQVRPRDGHLAVEDTSPGPQQPGDGERRPDAARQPAPQHPDGVAPAHL